MLAEATGKGDLIDVNVKGNVLAIRLTMTFLVEEDMDDITSGTGMLTLFYSLTHTGFGLSTFLTLLKWNLSYNLIQFNQDGLL